MLPSLSVAQIQALAPDAASIAAGKKLGRATSWQNLGHSDAAVWGECQGSALYQTRVALADFASKCSCPSRKFPCKHAIGLLFVVAESPGALTSGAAPDWVVGWLEKRGSAQESKKARAEAAAEKPVDEVAQAKRARKRHDNVLAGLDQLDAWMSDLIRQGLSRVRAEPPSFWESQARRMVDAQAPGLASRIRRMGEREGVGESWAQRTLHELGATMLLTHAYRRLDRLEPGLAADVRRLLGYSLDQVEVIAHGDVVEDDWVVLAEVTHEEERVRVQRAWLRGEACARTAMILQFAAGPTGRFAETFVGGTRFRAGLAFWPSAYPQRALVVERKGAIETVRVPPPVASISACLDRFAVGLGRLPWLERDLFALERVVPLTPEADGTSGVIVDDADRALALVGKDHDVLLALSGGRPLTLLGEWDGYALSPLVVWQGERMIAVGRRRE